MALCDGDCRSALTNRVAPWPCDRIEPVPLYEYQCTKCAHRFERIQKFSDPLVKKCPECGGKVEQLLSAPAVQFKGSGWYVTDYAKKGSSGKPASSEAGKSADKSDSKPATEPSKSETKKPDKK